MQFDKETREKMYLRLIRIENALDGMKIQLSKYPTDRDIISVEKTIGSAANLVGYAAGQIDLIDDIPNMNNT